MDIQAGKIYENKTWRFIAPCLKLYGDEFVKKFSLPFKLAVGIYDTLLDGTPYENERNIFILLDKAYQVNSFNIFYEWVKQQDYYVMDYSFDSNLKESNRVMIVLKFPEKHSYIYDSFLKGEYSKMFPDNNAPFFYNSNNGRLKELDVVLKNITYIPDFLSILKKEFSTELSMEDIESIEEYELPLKRVEEIFNCQKSNTIFIPKDFNKNSQTLNI